MEHGPQGSVENFELAEEDVTGARTIPNGAAFSGKGLASSWATLPKPRVVSSKSLTRAAKHTDITKTAALKQALNHYQFNAGSAAPDAMRPGSRHPMSVRQSLPIRASRLVVRNCWGTPSRCKALLSAAVSLRWIGLPVLGPASLKMLAGNPAKTVESLVVSEAGRSTIRSLKQIFGKRFEHNSDYDSRFDINWP
jgi:hypothetical protein